MEIDETDEGRRGNAQGIGQDQRARSSIEWRKTRTGASIIVSLIPFESRTATRSSSGRGTATGRSRGWGRRLWQRALQRRNRVGRRCGDSIARKLRQRRGGGLCSYVVASAIQPREQVWCFRALSWVESELKPRSSSIFVGPIPAPKLYQGAFPDWLVELYTAIRKQLPKLGRKRLDQ